MTVSVVLGRGPLIRVFLNARVRVSDPFGDGRLTRNLHRADDIKIDKQSGLVGRQASRKTEQIRIYFHLDLISSPIYIYSTLAFLSFNRVHALVAHVPPLPGAPPPACSFFFIIVLLMSPDLQPECVRA
jgi:hypothetical protein